MYCIQRHKKITRARNNLKFKIELIHTSIQRCSRTLWNVASYIICLILSLYVPETNYEENLFVSNLLSEPTSINVWRSFLFFVYKRLRIVIIDEFLCGMFKYNSEWNVVDPKICRSNFNICKILQKKINLN